MRVKICGITKLEDALIAIKYGVDALGFVFYPDSPRYIEPIKVSEIIAKIPPFVQTVGLFVHHSSDEVNQIMKTTKLNLAQIHKSQSNEFYTNLQYPYIKVARIKDKNSFLDTNEYHIVDAFIEEFGGEGKRVDLELLQNMDLSKIVLAGGINIDNIKEITNLGLYGVDVSSGVESIKGIKDSQKIKQLLQKIKN